MGQPQVKTETPRLCQSFWFSTSVALKGRSHVVDVEPAVVDTPSSYEWSHNPYLAGGFKYLLFSPLLVLGEIIQFDEHIFQMGWLNHQLVINGRK